MMHGGSHSRNNGCGPGMMYQNGGCVPASGGMRRGGRTRRRMRHGGHHHQVNANHLANSAQMATYHHHNAFGMGAGDPVYPMGTGAGESMYEAMNGPSYQASVPESSHNHGRHGARSIPQMRRGGRTTKRMMHGGPHNGPSDSQRKSAKRDSMGRK